MEQPVVAHDSSSPVEALAPVEKWAARYNGPANDSDAAYALAVDGMGNVYVIGESMESVTGSDYATIKYFSESWVPFTPGTGQVELGARAVGPQGWAMGIGGTIRHTSDGGATWGAQTSGTSQWLYGVVFGDSLHGWAVGDSGLILHTSDGGTAWTPQASGTPNTLAGVSFVGSVATADAAITFGSAGYRVDGWGTVTQDGSTFRADATVSRWTGPSATVMTRRSHTYDLGTVTPGSYTFEFYANGTLVKSVPFSVSAAAPALHDVAVTAISPASLTVGRRGTVYVTVENQGKLTESFTVELYAGGSRVGTVMVKGLAAGKSRKLAFRWAPSSAGGCLLTAKVRDGDVPRDVDAGDRTALKTVSVAPGLLKSGAGRGP
ncbi:MAG: CARDB domain-containing protein [Chloroflexota bacterium]